MRKKKLRLLAVLLAACMLCSCSAPVYPRSTDEPQLQFYYCTGEGADTGIGALAARPVSVPDERPDAVLQQYLTAPAGEGFSLPDGLSSSCAFDSCEDGTLTLLLDETAPEGLPASLAAACLTLTMTQLDGVDRVRLVRTQRQTEVTYTAEQFLLYDTSADQPEYVVRLYYPDKDGLLAAREAVVRTADPEQLPLLALQALVSREVPVNLTRAIPYRTQVLDLSVTNGSASVVLSDDFMSCDVSAQQAANAVRAIAATLCALDSINHITEPESVRKMFWKVGEYVRPGGLFVFDVNTEYKHRQVLGNETFVYDTDEVYCVWQNTLEDGLLVTIDLDFFVYDEENDCYYRESESFAERAYSHDFLCTLLAENGFELVTVYGDDSFDPAGETTQRAIYVAKKTGKEN